MRERKRKRRRECEKEREREGGQERDCENGTKRHEHIFKNSF